MIRRSLEGAAEPVLTSSIPLAALLRRARLHDVVLAYHNIVPDDEKVTGEAALHLPLSRFRDHLDGLQRHVQLVSLRSLVEDARASARDATETEAQTGRAGDQRAPRVAITFDDAYRGTLELGLPELVSRRVPATVFVPSGLVDTGAFWWDVVPGTEVEREDICLRSLGGDGERILQWATADGRRLATPGPFQVPGTLKAIRRAASLPGIRLAPHTRTHRNLSTLEASHIEEEFDADLRWLADRGLSVDPWVAYPYGAASPEVCHVAADRLDAGFLVEGGPFRGGSVYRLPRVSIPAGASAKNVLLRVTGVIDDEVREQRP